MGGVAPLAASFRRSPAGRRQLSSAHRPSKRRASISQDSAFEEPHRTAVRTASVRRRYSAKSACATEGRDECVIANATAHNARRRGRGNPRRAPASSRAGYRGSRAVIPIDLLLEVYTAARRPPHPLPPVSSGPSFSPLCRRGRNAVRPQPRIPAVLERSAPAPAVIVPTRLLRQNRRHGRILCEGVKLVVPPGCP